MDSESSDGFCGYGSGCGRYVAVYCRMLQCVAVCCSVLQNVAACCSVWQVCCSVLQCVAVCNAATGMNESCLLYGWVMSHI